MEKSVDIIVFGATGFTGKCTALQLARITREKYLDIKWGIAGRSETKLGTLMQEINDAGYNTENIKIIRCDAEDELSLEIMLRLTKVVINCTGVHINISPKVVKLCIETGTHYVDISSEIYHILTLYRDYDKTAKDANILVIPCCGYSSIPMEAGMIHLDKNFKGTLHSVECYVENFLPISLPTKVLVHTGTWTSLVHVLVTFKKHLALKKEILPQPTEPQKDIIQRRFFFRNNGQLWFPWPGVENDTVQMSQRYLHEESGKRPIYFNAFTTCEKWYHFLIIPAIYIYYYLCYFKCFANLLINYPRVFTFGLMSEKGPTYETRQKLNFSFSLNGTGWQSGDQNGAPTKKKIVKVSGKDPYDSTACAVIMSAITILKQRQNMPTGGVITPGAAFHNTDIVDRLKDGFTFEVL